MNFDDPMLRIRDIKKTNFHRLGFIWSSFTCHKHKEEEEIFLNWIKYFSTWRYFLSWTEFRSWKVLSSRGIFNLKRFPNWERYITWEDFPTVKVLCCGRNLNKCVKNMTKETLLRSLKMENFSLVQYSE